MPWMPNDRRNVNFRDRGHNLPTGRVEGAIADADRALALNPPHRTHQVKLAADAVGRAARDAINELIDAQRTGYLMPATAALLEDHGKELPASARAALCELLDEVRPVIASGDRGNPREAARRFAWVIAERMVDDEGWRPKQKPLDAPGETPEALAARIPRG